MEDGFEVSKEDKRKKKSKKKAEVPSVVELDGSRDEHVKTRDCEEADDCYEKEKEKKKRKKQRNLEPMEDNDKSSNEIHTGGKERSWLQTNDGKDLGNDTEVRARKEKKRHKEHKMTNEKRSWLQTADGKDLGNDTEVRATKEKKRHKEHKIKNESESLSFPVEILKDKDMDKYEFVKEKGSSQKDNIAVMKNRKEQIESNKNKKGRRDSEVGDFKGKKKTTAVEKVRKVRENVDDSEKVEKKKRKRKREKKESKDDLSGGVREMMGEELCKESIMIEDKDFGDSKDNAHSSGNKTEETDTKNGNKGNRKKPNSVETCSKDPKPKVNSKKVRFSGHVEVFPSSDGPSTEKEKNQEDDGLVRGKRFTPEEDEMIKEAVFNYIRAHNLGEEGLHMVMHCKSYPELKYCWREIGTAFPHRPFKAIYYRAHILFERDEKRSWTKEEFELVRKFHEENGPKWRKLADALGKHRVHLKDTWRRIKLPNRKRGRWSQEEYQTLFDLVNIDLQMKAFEEKKTKHGMLRDNISWTAISDKLSTRTDAVCCVKWYDQLTSPMVAEGNWADTDDYRLLDALFNLDACCIEDVDWDYLLEHRSGYACRKRWNQMVSHLGEHGNKSFAEQVDVLSKRYCPDLIETREAWDSKPPVD